MAAIKISIEDFLKKKIHAPVLDVRSPLEYKHAHIPGAYTLPLFTDAERVVVGTTYKQQSRQSAIKYGLDFFGLKMRKMVEEAEQIINNQSFLASTTESDNSSKRQVLVHCWRGGMRSAAVAWLLDLYGYEVYVLEGGYKSFRRWALHQFEKTYPIKLLGGYTGSGKTKVLKALKDRGESIVDLENLAEHKGSAFGNLGMPGQPSQEHFENKLALSLYESSAHIMDTKGSCNCLWIEDESQRIGDVNIPISFWNQMRTNNIMFLDIPFEERLHYIVEEYGHFEKERLVNAVIRIKKRLGGLETKEAIHALIEDRTEECFRILLRYYDKWYLKGLNNREGLEKLKHNIICERVTEANSQKLI